MFFDHLSGAGFVCAHRGARALAPENTLLAARRALELGANYWETDVHMTADGQLVIFHDDELARTTDVQSHSEFLGRRPWSVSAFTLEELRTLDAGSWFGPRDQYGTVASGDVSTDDIELMQGVRIPTFGEAMGFSKENAFPVNVEIKDQLQRPNDLVIVGEVLNALREYEVEDLVLISSFNHAYLAEMHRLAPHIPLAVLVEDRQPENIPAYLQSLGATTYHPDKDLIDTELVRSLTRQGIRVAPWTVNDMEEALMLIDAGCFGVITDFTHTLRRLLTERES